MYVSIPPFVSLSLSLSLGLLQPWPFCFSTHSPRYFSSYILPRPFRLLSSPFSFSRTSWSLVDLSLTTFLIVLYTTSPTSSSCAGPLKTLLPSFMNWTQRTWESWEASQKTKKATHLPTPRDRTALLIRLGASPARAAREPTLLSHPT